MSKSIKPNAFVFKAFIDGEYRLCVCPRIKNKWSEKDIVYVKDDPYKEFNEVLDNKLFSVIFVSYTLNETTDEFSLKSIDSHYLKSDTAVAKEMYRNGTFFETIEKGYQLFYEQSERKGIETETDE
jgi:hypothetical protein